MNPKDVYDSTTEQPRERPAWADSFLARSSSGQARSPITAALLEQAILDEGLYCFRSRSGGRFSTFWVHVPDGAAQIPESVTEIPDDAWRIDWTVRRDTLICSSTAECGSIRSRMAARTVAERWNVESESCHRIGLLPNGVGVTTRAAIPLPLGVTVIDLQAIVRMLVSDLPQFHLAVIMEMVDSDDRRAGGSSA